MKGGTNDKRVAAAERQKCCEIASLTQWGVVAFYINFIASSLRLFPNFIYARMQSKDDARRALCKRSCFTYFRVCVCFCIWKALLLAEQPALILLLIYANELRHFENSAGCCDYLMKAWKYMCGWLWARMLPLAISARSTWNLSIYTKFIYEIVWAAEKARKKPRN